MKRGLEKLVKKTILGVVGISMFFSSVKCYSTTPITETPLYKYLITPKINLKYQEKSLESKNQQVEKQPEKNEKEAEIISDDKVYKPSDKPIYQIPSNNKPTYNQSYEKINKNPDLSALNSDMTFSEAINVFRNSTSPPLNIVVLWKDLEENSDVYMDTPIGIDAIPGISLRTHLELMLRAVSSDPKSLGYIVDKGVITIATQNSLPRKMKARVYDITDLVGQPANYFIPPMGLGAMGYGGMTPGMGMGGLGMGAYGGMGYGGYGGTGMGYGGMTPGMGYGGYRGMPYGGGYGMPSGGMGYGGAYGGQPYGGMNYGRSFITRGYGTRIGSIPTGTSLNVNPYIRGNYVTGNYGFNKGQELADLIEASISRR